MLVVHQIFNYSIEFPCGCVCVKWRAVGGRAVIFLCITIISVLLAQKYIPRKIDEDVLQKTSEQTTGLGAIQRGNKHTGTDDEILSRAITQKRVKDMECPYGQRLDLAGRAEIQVKEVRFLIETGTFRDIDLSHCHAVDKMPYAPDATILNLMDCYRISKDTLEELPYRCPQLTSLNLRCCLQVTSKVVVALAEGFPELVSLNLSGCNKVDDESIISLANNCPVLAILHLAGCSKISDKALQALAHKCRRLGALNLAGCFKVTS